jgi:flagellar basal body P-ring formation protein FlgA
MKALFLFLVALVMAYPAFADTGVRVVVPTRDIARGETVGESDLSYQVVAAGNVLSGTATSIDGLVGMQTRRVLRAGESVRADDFRKPILVMKGATVTMTFTVPGVTLTATGKAMSEGGEGETVTVLNPASYRQISAVVTGPGTVRAEVGMGGAARIASNKTRTPY